MRSRLLLGIVAAWAMTSHAAPSFAARAAGPVTNHGDYNGCVLAQDGSDVVLVWEGIVTGSLSVPAGHISDPLTATFLHTDSTRYTPDPPNTLWLTIADSTTVYPVNVNGWTFALQGLKTGTTTLKVRVLNVTHFDFTSPAITMTSAVPVGVWLPRASHHDFTGREVGGAVLLDFATPRRGRVQLDAFAADGRALARIADVEVDAGRHRVQWTPDATARGVAFVRLRSTAGHATARVAVTR